MFISYFWSLRELELLLLFWFAFTSPNESKIIKFTVGLYCFHYTTQKIGLDPSLRKKAIFAKPLACIWIRQGILMKESALLNNVYHRCYKGTMKCDFDSRLRYLWFTLNLLLTLTCIKSLSKAISKVFVYHWHVTKVSHPFLSQFQCKSKVWQIQLLMQCYQLSHICTCTTYYLF